MCIYFMKYIVFSNVCFVMYVSIHLFSKILKKEYSLCMCVISVYRNRLPVYLNQRYFSEEIHKFELQFCITLIIGIKTDKGRIFQHTNPSEVKPSRHVDSDGYEILDTSIGKRICRALHYVGSLHIVTFYTRNTVCKQIFLLIF